MASSAAALHPIFSADGRTIAFFAGGKLRRASVDGGAAIDVASAPGPWGGTFDANGRIVFVPGLYHAVFSLDTGKWREVRTGHSSTSNGNP